VRIQCLLLWLPSGSRDGVAVVGAPEEDIPPRSQPTYFSSG
jgi:hypothetical protein